MVGTSLILGVAGISAIATIGVAAGSAGCRALLNVIDRSLFAHRRLPVLSGSMLNNLLATVVGVPFVGCFFGFLDIASSLVDLRVLIFAMLAQCIATLFAFAFVGTTVPRIIIVSKIPDIFIPLGLWVIVGKLDNYLFSLATIAACAPLLISLGGGGSIEERRKRFKRCSILFSLVVCIVVQGSLSPVLVGMAADSFQESAIYTAALLVWRTTWSFMAVMWQRVRRRGETAVRIGHVVDIHWGLLGIRAVVTLLAQFTFVYVLSVGDPSIAWPVLNSTPLIATVASSLMLKEHPTKTELASVVLLFGVAIGRGLIG